MRKTNRHCRGTMIAYFLVILGVITTGLLSTLAITSGAQTQVANLTLKRDQAYYAAEAGVQRAFWMLEMDNNWRNNGVPLTGSVGSASYSVMVSGDWNSPVLLSSTGSVNAGSTSAASVTVTAVATPSVIVPAISLGKDFDNSGNVTIKGDVQAKGSITTSGKLREVGSLFAGSSITTRGSIDVTGAVTPNDPNITIPTVDTAWLKAHATATINVPSGKKATDITSVNLGNGGIVYFQGGDINFKGHVTITGSGTIVTDGNVSIQSAAAFGSSNMPATANIVTGGNFDINGYLGLVGSIYAGGTITKSGGLEVTGVIVGQADLSTNGGMTITIAQPPSFDTRITSSGIGTMVLATETGPIF
jgi:hypothetical protein